MKYIVIKKSNLKFIITTIITTIIIITSMLCYNNYHYSFEYSNSNTKIITEDITSNFRNIFNSEEKIAYLTFDDGPTSKVTPKILDILNKLEVKANFFVLGKHVEQFPDILKREYEEGHFIANHGYSHNNEKLYQSKKNFINEIKQTDNIIGQTLGINDFCSHIFRFPNGSFSKQYYSQKQKCIKYLSEIDYTYIDWNVLNNDSMQKLSNYKLLSNLKNSAKGKGTIVILMHDTGDVNNTYDVLEDSINYLKEEGYTFKTFYDLF